MIYIASPYSNADPIRQLGNYHAAIDFTAKCMIEGIVVFSPVVHCHELALMHAMPTDFTFWSNYNYHMLGKANGLFVLALPGWEQSVGVAGEIKFAQSLNIPVTYFDLHFNQMDLAA